MVRSPMPASGLPPNVIRPATFPCLLLALAAAPGVLLHAQTINQTVEGIERHYNRLGSLQMQFEQSMEYAGRTRMTERGTLYLLRPGKMRWDYSEPEGKLAVSDGTIFRMYNPRTNQVRQVELEALTDLRAPLSFLLGRMRLRRMFGNLRVEEVESRPVLIGEGRNGRDFYSRVEFAFDPNNYRIDGIKILGLDDSVNMYRFSSETLNPRLAMKIFEFDPPPGAEVLPLTRNFNDLPAETKPR